jgi:nucleoside-diphosphate-sugar epimerase
MIQITSLLENQNMKNLGVVGASGFFGLTFVNSFLNGNLEAFNIKKLTLVSRNTSDKLRQIAAKNSGKIQLIDSDVCELNSVPKCDYWLHFAASSSSERYQKNAKFEFKNNTDNLQYFAALVERSNSVSSILFASSGAVYKSSLTALSEISPLVSRATSVNRTNAYAQSKLDSEEVIQNISSSKIKVTIARCFTFCGPELPLTSHFAVGNFVSDILARRPIHIKAPCPVFRSYLHTDDLVKWLMVMVTDERASGQILNVGSQNAISLLSVAETLAKHFNLSLKRAFPETEYNTRSPTSYFPDVSKANRLLGLEPSESSIEAVLRMAETIKMSQT